MTVKEYRGRWEPNEDLASYTVKRVLVALEQREELLQRIENVVYDLRNLAKELGEKPNA